MAQSQIDELIADLTPLELNVLAQERLLTPGKWGYYAPYAPRFQKAAKALVERGVLCDDGAHPGTGPGMREFRRYKITEFGLQVLKALREVQAVAQALSEDPSLSLSKGVSLCPAGDCDLATEIDAMIASMTPEDRAFLVNNFIPPARPELCRKVIKAEGEGLWPARHLCALGVLKDFGWLDLCGGYGFEITQLGRELHKAILEMWEAQEALDYLGPPEVGIMVANLRAIRCLELKR